MDWAAHLTAAETHGRRVAMETAVRQLTTETAALGEARTAMEQRYATIQRNQQLIVRENGAGFGGNVGTQRLGRRLSLSGVQLISYNCRLIAHVTIIAHMPQLTLMVHLQFLDQTIDQKLKFSVV